MTTLPSETYPGHCSVEIYRRSVPGRVFIDYWVTATRPTNDNPRPDPIDIIAWDETYYVVVCINLEDPVRRLLCGTLCVDIDVDTCGPAPDLQFPEQDVPLDPCSEDGTYCIWFELPAGTFAPPPDYPNRCGRIYRICITVGSHDLCDPPNPGLIWGHCDSLEIAVHPPVPR
jgi:hypothetical protein